MRYFLLREGVPDSDTNIHAEKFVKFVNVELANTLGNLYQRCLPFNKKLSYPIYNQIEHLLNDQDRELISKLDHVANECDREFEIFNFYKGIRLK